MITRELNLSDRQWQTLQTVVWRRIMDNRREKQRVDADSTVGQWLAHEWSVLMELQDALKVHE